jgi:AcrR family transcriptional regulator
VTTRQRMTKDDRRRQLIAVARGIVVDEGADALTLGHLAATAHISKPVVYDHFGTRSGALLALYEDFDRRQTDMLVQALNEAPSTLAAQLETIAGCHVRCVLDHGAELGGVTAALSGSPDLAAVRRTSEAEYVAICRRAIGSCEPNAILSDAAAFAFLGAADSLCEAALDGSIGRTAAETTLATLLSTLVSSSSAMGRS